MQQTKRLSYPDLRRFLREETDRLHPFCQTGHAANIRNEARQYLLWFIDTEKESIEAVKQFCGVATKAKYTSCDAIASFLEERIDGKQWATDFHSLCLEVARMIRAHLDLQTPPKNELIVTGFTTKISHRDSCSARVKVHEIIWRNRHKTARQILTDLDDAIDTTNDPLFRKWIEKFSVQCWTDCMDKNAPRDLINAVSVFISRMRNENPF